QNTIQYAGTSIYLGTAGIMFACLFCEGDLTRLGILRRSYLLAALIATLAGYLGFFHLVPGYQHFLDNERVSATFKDPNVYGPFLIFPLLLLIVGFMTRAFASAASSWSRPCSAVCSSASRAAPGFISPCRWS